MALIDKDKEVALGLEARGQTVCYLLHEIVGRAFASQCTIGIGLPVCTDTKLMDERGDKRRT